ncbi:MAG TPA: bifunctional hydroxymethylpyrimidine kinase/phosphomethylpyrimidine kinase, partial [Acidimicrobiales bacterium]|nr:bifunctional hydroxymethylpyrimidine kinase/phosphomethylpyrimidine kinase [Acidimicrobiales bacterium]
RRMERLRAMGREAAVLAGVDANDLLNEDDMVAVGRLILAFGPAAVLVKGGHVVTRGVTSRRSPDILVDAQGATVFDAPRVATTNDQGTGCSLSAAICAGLARGRSVAEAVAEAKAYVRAALEGAATWRLGRGRGPIDHFGWGR